MENKAPLSGWQRIGVTGRSRTREGVALCWPPAGLQTTPNITVGVGRWPQAPGQGEGAVRSVESWTGEGGSGEVKALLGTGEAGRVPLLIGEGVQRQRGLAQFPAFCYVLPSGNFSVLAQD
jgi:hypothetical protein